MVQPETLKQAKSIIENAITKALSKFNMSISETAIDMFRSLSQTGFLGGKSEDGGISREIVLNALSNYLYTELDGEAATAEEVALLVARDQQGKNKICETPEEDSIILLLLENSIKRFIKFIKEKPITEEQLTNIKVNCKFFKKFRIFSLDIWGRQGKKDKTYQIYCCENNKVSNILAAHFKSAFKKFLKPYKITEELISGLPESWTTKNSNPMTIKIRKTTSTVLDISSIAREILKKYSIRPDNGEKEKFPFTAEEVVIAIRKVIDDANKALIAGDVTKDILQGNFEVVFKENEVLDIINKNSFINENLNLKEEKDYLTLIKKSIYQPIEDNQPRRIFSGVYIGE